MRKWMVSFLAAVVLLPTYLLPAAAVGFSQKAAAESTWQITKVSSVSESQGQRYLLDFRLVTDQDDFSTSDSLIISNADLDVLVKVQGVSSKQQLVGTKFAVKSGMLPDRALQLRIFSFKHPDYKPPKSEELYKQLARSVAAGVCPDFSDQNPEVVDQAFLKIYSTAGADHSAWFRTFKTDVERLDPSVSIEVKRWPSSPMEFGTNITLVASKDDVAVIFGVDPFPDGPAFGCFYVHPGS